MSSWDLFYKSFITHKGYRDVLNGLGATVTIAVLGLIIGIILGIFISISKVVPQNSFATKFWSKTSDVYVWLFRGTPIVVQLLLIYYVLFPLIGIKMPSLWVAILVFGMNSGAYVSEIMRAGILSVDKGQMEAGRSLGLGYGRSMFNIVLPQSFKNILPTLGNEFIVLVKETSVVSFIAVVDLTRAFKAIGDRNYDYIIPYLMLAACYLILVTIISLGVKSMEKRLRKSERN